jgi:tRNA A37 threonylcarbamoyltransferase TsaD
MERCGGAQSIDAVAVAAGPGLSPCLSVGMMCMCVCVASVLVRFLILTVCVLYSIPGCQIAQEWATRLGVPLYAVNHLEAHSLVAHMTDHSITFPHLTLLLSGGHTELWHAQGVGHYTILGNTLDDAVRAMCYHKVHENDSCMYVCMHVCMYVCMYVMLFSFSFLLGRRSV